MSTTARTVVLLVAVVAFVGSVLLVVLDPTQLGSWLAAVALLCVIAATVAEMGSSRGGRRR
jgi:1,4-dihydroxy-2-naphthoate octaprenyltransferase